MSGSSSKRSSALDVPIRELLPPASTIAVGHASLLGPIGGIVRRRSLFEPEPELSQCMGEAPFLEHGSGHGESGADQFPRLAGQRVVEQPFFECFRPWIVFNCLSQEIPLDRKPEGIGCLIPLAFSSFRGFERGEEGPAYVGWAKLGR